MGRCEAIDEMTDGVCIAALLSGLLGSMGFGGGSVLIIYLTLFLSVAQKQAQGINLLFFIPCAIISILLNLKNGLVRLKTGLPVIIGGIFGVAVGSLIVDRLTSPFLGKIFGGFVVLMGVITLFSKTSSKKEKK